MQERSESNLSQTDPGETVYNEDGQPLGIVTGRTEDGFEVEAKAAADPQDANQEELPGHGVGEGYIMWRCADCGKMGELEDGFPPECPNCGADEEMLSEVVED